MFMFERVNLRRLSFSLTIPTFVCAIYLFSTANTKAVNVTDEDSLQIVNYYNATAPSENKGDDDGTGFWMRLLIELGKTLGFALLTAIGVPLVINLLINILGCRSGGIALDSCASMVMSSIGNVAAGSFFAVVQSLGATGGVPFFSPVGIVAGILGGVGYMIYSILTYRLFQTASSWIVEQYDVVANWIGSLF